MSPTRSRRKPLSERRCSRIVKQSSSACDGCSCIPSPAFTMGIFRCLASTCGAPEEGCRITMHSAPMAARVIPVSTSDSPFSMLDAAVLTSVVDAPSDLAASSNEQRVRVLAWIDFIELDLNDFVLRGLHLPSHECGFNGQLAMSAIDQHQQLHATRASVVKEGVERGSNGTAGVEDIVYEDDVFIVDVESNFHRIHDRLWTGG